MAYSTLRVQRDERGVATVTIDRAPVRNAFDATLIGELHDVAQSLAGDQEVRVVVLASAGDVFSAGADLAWMRGMRNWTFEENLADSRRLDAMFRALWDLPKPLVGRVQGHALGGGSGLVAVCDVVVASRDAMFGFPEALLGIAPAVVSPYVVRKVGTSFARAVFVTGERVSAQRALQAGLIHEVVDADALDDAVAAVVQRCLAASPAGAAACKALVDQALQPLDRAAADAVRVIAALRVGEDGQEGMQAFFDRRPPAWAPQ